MSNHEQKKKLTEPWRHLHKAVWLVGLAIVAGLGWWWPGILVLVAASAALEGILMLAVPHAFEAEGAVPATAGAAVSAPAPAAPPREHRLELLPSGCPQCGGPVRRGEVRWTGPQSAECSFCGSNLPMRQG